MSADLIGSWLGVLLSVAGFGVTFWQLKKTRSAAEATKRVLGESRNRYALNALLVSIPDMLAFEKALSAALRFQKGRDVASALTAWRQAAAQTRGHLENLANPPHDLMESLGIAISLAAVSEQALTETPSDIGAAMKQSHVSISVASADANSALATLQGYNEPYADA